MISYLDWMTNLVDHYDDRNRMVDAIGLVGDGFQYKYFTILTDILSQMEFYPMVPMDNNRVQDGLALRRRFIFETGSELGLPDRDAPCSILEMMVALSLRCDESIMYNSREGSRIDIWFALMLANLGLAHCDDTVLQDNSPMIDKVVDILERFLQRKYTPTGEGSLFHIPNVSDDMREVEIWCQLCWYLNYLEDTYGLE